MSHHLICVYSVIRAFFHFKLTIKGSNWNSFVIASNNNEVLVDGDEESDDHDDETEPVIVRNQRKTDILLIRADFTIYQYFIFSDNRKSKWERPVFQLSKGQSQRRTLSEAWGDHEVGSSMFLVKNIPNFCFGA